MKFKTTQKFNLQTIFFYFDMCKKSRDETLLVLNFVILT